MSAIKADVGSIGGHLAPSAEVLTRIAKTLERLGSNIISDFFLTYLGDDVCMLLVHQKGTGNREIHELGWEALREGAKEAKTQGLYAAGQDLVKDAFSGNLRGLGPGVAELSFVPRPAEAFILFLADKTSPGAFNLPFFLAFADPLFCPGLILSSSLGQGFRFVVLDAVRTDAEWVIELNVPEDLYDLAALLSDPGRFGISEIYSRSTGEQVLACSVTRLNILAGRYVGKDDPVAIVRVQRDFPATGEVLAPFAICPFVPGFLRGSHYGSLVPVPQKTPASYFDGPPQVMALAFSLSPEGRLSSPVDLFAHPFWEEVRRRAVQKTLDLRAQGFVSPAMLPTEELEYTGIAERIEALSERFFRR